MRITALSRHESPKLSYAECDRGSPNSSDDAVIINSNHQNKKQGAILTKLIWGMMKSKDRVAYTNLKSDSGVLEVSSSRDKVDIFVDDPSGALPEKINDGELTVASTPPDNLCEDDMEDSKFNLTPEDVIREDDMEDSKFNLTPEDVILQSQVTPKKSNAKPFPGNDLTGEQCLIDIRNFEISTIKIDIGMITGGSETIDTVHEENDINRHLFYEDAEVKGELKKHGAVLLKTPTREIICPGNGVPLLRRPRKSQDDAQGQDDNKDHGLTKLEMRDLWDAAKDVMKALDFYDSSKATTDLRSKSHFVKEALKKYNLQEFSVDQIVKDVTGTNEPPKEIIFDEKCVISKKPLKTGTEVNSERGTELKYSTPQRGPKQKQTTLILPSDDVAHCEILTASPLTTAGNEGRDSLNDSDVFNFDSLCIPTSADVKKIEVNSEVFDPFTSFDSKDVVQDHDVLTKFDCEDVVEDHDVPSKLYCESSEFVVFSPFVKDRGCSSGKEPVKDNNEESQLGDCNNDEAVLTQDEDEIEKARNECNNDESTFEEESTFEDEATFEDEDEIDEDFPSLDWNASCPDKPPIARKLNFDSTVTAQRKGSAGEGLPAILSNADSLLLSLQSISLGASTLKKNLEDEEPVAGSSKRDVEEILQSMREDCVQRLDSNIAKVAGSQAQKDQANEVSQSSCTDLENRHDVSRRVESSTPVIQDKQPEKSQLKVQIVSPDVVNTQPSPAGIMDFPLDEVVEDVSQIWQVTVPEMKLAIVEPTPSLKSQTFRVTVPEMKLAIVETTPSPKLSPKRAKGEYVDDELSHGIQVTDAPTNRGVEFPREEKKAKKSCPRISSAISERIAQLQKNFQA
jgi:hypothetical protein